MQTAQVAGPEAVAGVAIRFADGQYYLGSEIRPRVRTPAEYVKQYIIPRFRKELADPHFVSSTDLPDYARAVTANYQGVPGALVRSARVRIEYESSGKPIEEDFVCTLVFFPMVGTVAWGGDCESYRAARGQLDAMMPMFRTIDRSAKVNIQWYNGVMQVAQLMQEGVRQSIENAKKVSDYIAQTNREISDTIRQSYENHVKTMDKCADNFDKVIRGVETYHSPFEDHPIEVPAGYNHVFTNALGEVIVTNDEFLKPGQVRNGDWREVEKTR
jgi:hypothetical protein